MIVTRLGFLLKQVLWLYLIPVKSQTLIPLLNNILKKILDLDRSSLGKRGQLRGERQLYHSTAPLQATV